MPMANSQASSATFARRVGAADGASGARIRRMIRFRGRDRLERRRRQHRRSQRAQCQNAAVSNYGNQSPSAGAHGRKTSFNRMNRRCPLASARGTRAWLVINQTGQFEEPILNKAHASNIVYRISHTQKMASTQNVRRTCLILFQWYVGLVGWCWNTIRPR
jgi:hypothetical protein